jgi:hypothetical protein
MKTDGMHTKIVPKRKQTTFERFKKPRPEIISQLSDPKLQAQSIGTIFFVNSCHGEPPWRKEIKNKSV